MDYHQLLLSRMNDKKPIMDMLFPKTVCECGICYRHEYKAIHLKTKTHLQYIKTHGSNKRQNMKRINNKLIEKRFK